MSSIVNILKKIAILFLKIVPLQNIILFESVPDFSDNTKPVYDELVRRGLNKKYKFIWITHDDSNILIPNVKTVSLSSIKAATLFAVSKAMISCNYKMRKKRKKQYYIHLSHGAALKDCSSHYVLPEHVDEAVSFSEYLAKYDAHNYNCSLSKMVVLGYPRNDLLFDEPINIHNIFPNCNFSKSIYWLPTYRQHKNGKLITSNVSMPIIYNEDIARKINKTAQDNNILIIIKPHPAQEISRIKKLDLSNLKFIDNTFLEKNSILNYELLRSVDAMISDYSSVYYDYLLVDKPIGLCWDDFDDYNSKEGFTVDPNYILAGGEKIYNSSDLCDFIKRIADGKDVLCEKRREIRDIVHKNVDNQSTKRVADHIEEKLNYL